MSPPGEPIDERLIAQFQEGNADAFRLLVAPHLPGLRARSRRWLGGRLLKKVSLGDVVQDALVIAFERRADFVSTGPNSFGHWLLGILDNCALTTIGHHAGTQKRDPERELTGEHRPPTCALRGREPSPSQVAGAAEERQLLREARATLSEDEQLLLCLVHDERLTLREAAARIGRPYEAVRKHHARILLKLGRAFRLLKPADHD